METPDIIKYMYWFYLRGSDLRKLSVMTFTSYNIGSNNIYVSESEVLSWIKNNTEINEERFYKGYYRYYD